MTSHQEAIKESQTPAEQVKQDWRNLLEKISYRGIVENIPFLAFIALLCITYITSNYRAVETQRAIEKEKEQLKELRWKYMDIKTKLMNAGVEAQVIRRGMNIGLQPLTLPAYTVTVDTNLTHPKPLK